MKSLKSVSALVIAAAMLLPSRGWADVVEAIPADQYVEFFGINAHFNWKGTIWESGAPVWQRRLGELGVRYVRTAMARTPFARDNLNTVSRNYGVRASVLLQPRKRDGSLDTGQVRPMLDDLRDHVGFEKVIAFEGPNEYSETKYSKNNTDWATEVRGFQKYLHTAVKTHGTWNTLPVIGPTIWHRFMSDYRELGNIGLYADHGNLHYYNGTRKPTLYGREENYQIPFKGVESPMLMAIQDAQTMAPGNRVFVTETGFNVRPVSPPSPYYLPERASAKYTLRLISDFFLERDKVQKAFLFSLIDEGSGKIYGLLRAPDLLPRPAFYAVKNAIAILADKGPEFTPGTLTYALSGDQSGIRTVILQKSDGRFYMMLWNDTISYDRKARMEVDPAPRQLTLDLSQHQFSTVNVYQPTGIDISDPNDGARPIQTISSPASVSLNVPDHVIIVEMVP